MKKCPYCAEFIQDEAIICKYCGKELVKNIEQVARARETVKTKNLGWKDIDILSEKWGESYTFIPKEATQKISSSVNKLVTGYLGPIFDIYLNLRIVQEKDVQSISMQAMGKSYLWAFLCFAAGVELGKNFLTEELVPICLFAFSKPYQIYMLKFLGGLSEKNIIGSSQIEQLASELDKGVNQTAVYLANIGWVYSEAITPKLASEKSDFYKSLQNLGLV